MNVIEASKILKDYGIRNMPLQERTKTPIMPEYQKTLVWHTFKPEHNLGLLTGSPIIHDKKILWFGAFDVDIERKDAPPEEVELEIEQALSEIEDITGIDTSLWRERSAGGHGGVHPYFVSKLPIMELKDYLLGKYKYISVSCWGLRSSLTFYNMAAYPSVVASDYKMITQGSYEDIVKNTIAHPLHVNNHIAMIARWPVTGDSKLQKLLCSLLIPLIWFTDDFAYKFLGCHVAGHGFRQGMSKEKIIKLATLLYTSKPVGNKDTTFKNLLKFIDDIYAKGDPSQCVSKKSTEEFLKDKYAILYTEDEAIMLASQATDALLNYCRGTKSSEEPTPKGVSEVTSSSDTDIEIDVSTVQQRQTRTQSSSTLWKKTHPEEASENYTDIDSIVVDDISKYRNIEKKFDDDISLTEEHFLDIGDTLLLFGDEGSGKTTIVADIIASFTTGTPLFGDIFHPIYKEGINVTYFHTDKYRKNLHHKYFERYKRNNEDGSITTIDMSKVECMYSKDLSDIYKESFSIDDVKTMKIVKDMLVSTESKLFIIDTLTVGLETIDPSSANDKKKLLAWLRAFNKIITDCGCACIFVSHNNKPSTGKDKPKLRDTYQGIKALSAAISYSLAISASEEGRSGTINRGKEGMFDFPKSIGYKIENYIPNWPDSLPANFEYASTYYVSYDKVDEVTELPKSVIDTIYKKILRVIRRHNNECTYSIIKKFLNVGNPGGTDTNQFYNYMSELQHKKLITTTTSGKRDKNVWITDEGLKLIVDYTDELAEPIPMTNVIDATPEPFKAPQMPKDDPDLESELELSLDIFATSEVEDIKELETFGDNYIKEEVVDLCNDIDLEAIEEGHDASSN